jgi:hypothetical protein
VVMYMLCAVPRDSHALSVSLPMNGLVILERQDEGRVIHMQTALMASAGAVWQARFW